MGIIRYLSSLLVAFCEGHSGLLLMDGRRCPRTVLIGHEGSTLSAFIRCEIAIGSVKSRAHY
jgi:hypothetical protein